MIIDVHHEILVVDAFGLGLGNRGFESVVCIRIEYE